MAAKKKVILINLKIKNLRQSLDTIKQMKKDVRAISGVSRDAKVEAIDALSERERSYKDQIREERRRGRLTRRRAKSEEIGRFNVNNQATLNRSVSPINQLREKLPTTVAALQSGGAGAGVLTSVVSEGLPGLGAGGPLFGFVGALVTLAITQSEQKLRQEIQQVANLQNLRITQAIEKADTAARLASDPVFAQAAAERAYNDLKERDRLTGNTEWVR